MSKLTMLSAPSASGKTTLAKQIMKEDGNAVRINRDDIRAMSISKWKQSREGWIIAAELALTEAAAKLKRNIIIDDTNLMPSDEDRWKNKAKEIGYNFEIIKIDVSLEECVARDAERIRRIGRAAIERQFLRAGLWKIPVGKQTVIFDIDGTLADLTHRVGWIHVGAPCPHCHGTGNIPIQVSEAGIHRVKYTDARCLFCEDGKIVKKNHDEFYDRVLLDEPIEAVINWIRACYEDYYVLIVSGRSPEKSGEDTIIWLKHHSIPYHHLLMRRSYHHGPDDEEKQLILDDILKMIPKEDIAFVVDDRPSVVAMWKRNGLKVFPVRGRDDDEFYEVMQELEATHPMELETDK